MKSVINFLSYSYVGALDVLGYADRERDGVQSVEAIVKRAGGRSNER